MQLPPLTHTIDGVDFTFIHVPEGFYLRGKTPEQGNQHEWALELPIVEMDIAEFYLQQTPVTVAQYSLFVQDAKVPQEENEKELWKPQKWALNDQGLSEKGYENHPMQNVSWYGAVAFTDWLSKKMERSVRLSTETEWEYAAKGGHFRDSFRYAGSDNLEEVGWYFENSANKTQEVAQKNKNTLGLYDLSGNVWEWCVDKTVRRKSVLDMVDDGAFRVRRGGGWSNDADFCRVAFRDFSSPDYRISIIGFRCAVSL